jgi:hypothetical protein
MPLKKKAITSVGKVIQEGVKAEQEPGDDILALPKSDDSDSSDGQSIDIRPSTFSRTSEEPKPQPLRNRAAPKRTVNGVNGSATSTARNGNSPKPANRTSPSSSFTSSSDSTKRKQEAPLSQLGSSMFDDFGRPNSKKPKKNTYGSSQSRYGSSQVSKTNAKAIKKSSIGSFFKSCVEILLTDCTEDSPPKKGFMIPTAIDNSDDSDESETISIFKPVHKSPAKSSLKLAGKKSVTNAVQEEEEEKLSAFNKPILDYGSDDLPSQAPLRLRLLDKLDVVPELAAGSPATQLAPFRKIELDGLGDDELISTARKIISVTGNIPRTISTYEDDFPTMTQLARCPMCYQPVDPDELRSFGAMNMRQQAKFCRNHQKKTAMETWELEDYPEIQWENLDSRIAKHYAFIKKLINGKDSHYRAVLEDAVKAGKNRTLLKSDSNLTPGYYGSRGLTEISESIMRKFTRQLKDRAPADPLMSARGFAGFVQSVLVPEVTVLLIMEDMSVNVERAREILIESVAVGELVHDEIKDVVRRRVEDSEGDGEFDD